MRLSTRNQLAVGTPATVLVKSSEVMLRVE